MLKPTKLIGAVLGLGCSTLALSATPASAAPEAEPVIDVRDVTRVGLMDRGRAAKVAITVVCPPAASRELTVVEVAQYGTRTSGPSGTHYESTGSIGFLECTGKAQRFIVVVTPLPSSQGRLSRGAAIVTIGGYEGPYPLVTNEYVRIR
jgi:hypothetical protein